MKMRTLLVIVCVCVLMRTSDKFTLNFVQRAFFCLDQSVNLIEYIFFFFLVFFCEKHDFYANLKALNNFFYSFNLTTKKKCVNFFFCF